jgi:hypothetical protein
MKNLTDFLKDWMGFRSAFNTLAESFTAHTAKVDAILTERKANDELETKFAQSEADLSTARQTIGTLETGVEEKDNRISALESDLAAANADVTAKQDIIDDPNSEANRIAVNIVAGTGTPALPAGAGDSAVSGDSLMDRYAKATGAEKTRIYRENKTAIINSRN